MLLFGKERKMMKMLIKHDFKNSFNEDNIELKSAGMDIKTIAQNMKLSKKKTLEIIKKLIAYKMLMWTNRESYWTVYQIVVTDHGFVEFQDGWKKYVKDGLIALAASAPFVSLLIYFHQISIT